MKTGIMILLFIFALVFAFGVIGEREVNGKALYAILTTVMTTLLIFASKYLYM